MTVAELIAGLQQAIADSDPAGASVADMRVLVFEPGSTVGRDVDPQLVGVYHDGSLAPAITLVGGWAVSL